MADGNRAWADGKKEVGGRAQMEAEHLYFDVDLQPVCRFTSGVKDVEKYVEYTIPEAAWGW